MKKIVIIGGGTVYHVRPHLALSAPAYGTTARRIDEMVRDRFDTLIKPFQPMLYLTRMAYGGEYRAEKRDLETNRDIANLVADLVADEQVKVIFFSAAMCDFNGSLIGDDDYPTPSGKEYLRAKSNVDFQRIMLKPAEKIISRVRRTRKDIFLVGFKTTTTPNREEMFQKGLTLLKKSSCNLVLVNDLHTRWNMIVTPERARYAVTNDRDRALHELVDMTYLRSSLNFTRSKVVDGAPIEWNSPEIPQDLKMVVDHAIDRGAYAEFLGVTNGHYAAKLDDETCLTSIRSTNFNDRPGLVKVKFQGENEVIAFGAKPSVGGQSQRAILRQYPDVDYIWHAHVRQKASSRIPVASQRAFECGSHECGENTARGLQKFGDIYAVMLDKHGPNVCWNKNVPPEKVIQFIDENFELSKHTSDLE